MRGSGSQQLDRSYTVTQTRHDSSSGRALKSAERKRVVRQHLYLFAYAVVLLRKVLLSVCPNHHYHLLFSHYAHILFFDVLSPYLVHCAKESFTLSLKT